MNLTEIFRAVADPVRLRLFSLLLDQGELCVCHLTEALSLPQSTISRHLALLRQASLVATRRDGKWMYYQLAEEIPEELLELIRRNRSPETLSDQVRLDSAQRC